MNIFLDTNILIDYKRGLVQAQKLLDLFISENIHIYTSVICAMELLRGDRDKRECGKTQEFLNLFTLLPINETISQTAYGLFLHYYQSYNLDIPDSLIAATALFYNMKFFTTNLKHFAMINGLILEKPYDV
jgi:predicted nucleic acid-binding protein